MMDMERERDRERETERDRQRETDRETDRENEKRETREDESCIQGNTKKKTGMRNKMHAKKKEYTPLYQKNKRKVRKLEVSKQSHSFVRCGSTCDCASRPCRRSTRLAEVAFAMVVPWKVASAEPARRG